jgi:sugar/nucleoside kinase (ribokinase family)
MAALTLPVPPGSLPSRAGLLPADGSGDIEHSITIVGDLRVDVSVQLGAYDFGPGCARYTSYREVLITPGGTALSMCGAFAPHFNTRHVVSALGKDSYSETLRSAVDEMATATTLREVDAPNGMTVALFRDADGSVPKSRFSVASPRSPYLSLDPDWVERNLGPALHSDILTMDCLLLVSPGSVAGAHSVARAARLADCLFAVDVVPHNLLDYVRRDEVVRLLAGANLVTAELETLAQIFDTPSRLPGNSVDAANLYHRLKPYLSQRHWVVIRFGALNIEHSLIFSSDGRSWSTDSGAEIRSGGYPSGSSISGVEYSFILTQWKHERDTREARRYAD